MDFLSAEFSLGQLSIIHSWGSYLSKDALIISSAMKEACIFMHSSFIAFIGFYT